MDPFLVHVAAAVVAATTQAVVDAAAEVVDRTVMVGTAAVEQAVVAPNPWHDQTAQTIESGAVEE